MDIILANPRDFRCAAGVDFARQGRVDSALAEFRSAAAVDPENAQAYWCMFQLLGQLGRIEESMRCLISALEKDPALAPPATHMFLAEYFESKHEYDNAFATLIRGEMLAGADLEPFERRIKLHVRLGQFDRAIEAFEDLIGRRPELAQHSNIEHVNLSLPNRLYRFDKSLSLLDRLLKLADAARIHSSFRNQFEIALIDCRRGRLSDGVAAFNSILAQLPNCVTTLYALAATLYIWSSQETDEKRRNEASDILEKALCVDPARGSVLYLKSKIRLDSAPAFSELAEIEKDLRIVSNTESLAIDAAADLIDVLQRQGAAKRSYPVIGEYIRKRETRALSNPLGRLGTRIITEVNSYAIGHLSALPVTYLKAKLLGWLPDYRTIFIAPDGMVSNPCLLEYFRPHFEIVSDRASVKQLGPWLEDLEFDTAFMPLPDGTATNTRIAAAAVQAEWERQNRLPLFTLAAEQQSKGWSTLESLGVPRGAWFVSLHVREGGYKRAVNCPHNYHRVAELESFYPAIEEITSRGGWVIRLGEPSMKPLPPTRNVIDYAHSTAKSDWMDVFLSSQCRFFLGTSAGIHNVAQMFETPCISTNYPPTLVRYNGKDLFLPKLLRRKSTGELLTFNEMMADPIYESESGRLFSELGLEFVDNTADEIVAVVKEMFTRLESPQASYSEEDLSLQARFRELISSRKSALISRIGSDFLRRHRALLS